MAPLLVGLGLAVSAVTAALAIVLFVDISNFPEISYACNINGLGNSYCTEAALKAGIYSVIAFSLIIAFSLVVNFYLRPIARTPVTIDPIVTKAFLIICFCVLLAHTIVLATGPAFASRLDESEHYSIFVSIENLLWPLILQLFVVQTDRKLRLLTISALLFIMALSPYRSVLLAIFLFGFALPLALSMYRSWKASGLFNRQHLKDATIAIAMFIVCLWGGYVDTATRAPSLLVTEQAKLAQASSTAKVAGNASRQAPAAEASGQPSSNVGGERQESLQTAPPAPKPAATPQTRVDTADVATHDDSDHLAYYHRERAPPPPPTGIVLRLLQRTAFPIYQAAIAGHLAEVSTLPSILDELKRKFRIGSAPALNEYLFRKIYGGEGFGQTTALYFGEAAAYFPGFQLLWMIGAPLLLVGLFLAYQRHRIEAGTLLGIALWRSSFSGLMPVLPALILQLSATAGMASLSRWMIGRTKSARSVDWISGLILGGVMFGLAIFQGSAIVQSKDRRAILIATFEAGPGCVLESPSWISIYADQALRAHHIETRTSLAWAFPNAAAVAMPFGHTVEAYLPEVASKVATLVRCPQSVTASPLTVSNHEIFEHKLNPTDYLALLLVLVGGASVMRSIRNSKNAQPSDPREVFG